MFKILLNCSAVALCAAGIGAANAADSPEPLPNDVLSVAKLPADGAHRAYVVDFNLPNKTAGRITVIDGDSGKMLGVIPAGYSGLSGMSPDKKTFYVTTTYYDRGTRGHRADVVEMWDLATLGFQGEVVIPNKHAEASSYPGLVSTTQDGRYLFVQNATPASSIAVVDTVKKKFAFELGTAGCWTAWPAPSRDDRITTICGDGAFLTLTFNQKGSITESKRSAPIFDPDSDPMFVQGAEMENGKILFISFLGKLRTVDVSGSTAAMDGAEWSIVPQSLQAENWRPGGYQMLAYHKKTGRLFVLMHKNGKEGSHKFPADEIWEIDVVHHTVVQRVPGNGALAMTITQDDHPKILCSNNKGELLVYSVGKTIVFERAVPQAANTSTEVLAP